MTANELADKLDEIYTGTDYEEIKQAATMLRQQQAEIKALKLRELTDEEILEIWRENEKVYPMDRSRLLDRTRACIKKASEK
jgi:hypothetical protein